MRISHLKYAGLAAIAVAALFSTTVTSLSQTSLECAPREIWVSMLAADFQESLIGKGLVRGTTVIEVFTTANGGTFTILATGPKSGPNGAYLESCMIVSGDHWASFTPTPAGNPS